jgi:hypothetical protein
LTLVGLYLLALLAEGSSPQKSTSQCLALALREMQALDDCRTGRSPKKYAPPKAFFDLLHDMPRSGSDPRQQSFEIFDGEINLRLPRAHDGIVCVAFGNRIIASEFNLSAFGSDGVLERHGVPELLVPHRKKQLPFDIADANLAPENPRSLFSVRVASP